MAKRPILMNGAMVRASLADVQPGGRVRLGDQAERARFEAWASAEGLNAHIHSANGMYSHPVARGAWLAWQHLSAQPHPPSSFDLEAMLAACVPGGDIADPQVIADNIRHWFAAQPSPGETLPPEMRLGSPEYLDYLDTKPSPGGQDALAALQQDYDKLLDSFNRQVEVAEKIAGRVLQQDDRIEELEEALAARQPVGELHLPPDGFYKIVYDDAQVPDESFARTGALDAALRRFEQISARWNAHLFVRFANNTRDCTVPNATPAQAVDLGQFREAVTQWKLAAERVIRCKGHAMAEDKVKVRDEAVRLLALIDSQVVGK
ncbi:TPA: hypothetical protein ACOFCD_000871 [Stenotrophomonas maltophilia]